MQLKVWKVFNVSRKTQDFWFCSILPVKKRKKVDETLDNTYYKMIMLAKIICKWGGEDTVYCCILRAGVKIFAKSDDFLNILRFRVGGKVNI